MIRKLQINNYKSLFDLKLEVSRFNVFIGENGCGKSNLLEAIALAAAAAANKLDHEFLGSRGIRVTEPQLMRSAFSDDSVQEPINIGVGFEDLNGEEKYTLTNGNYPYAKWTRLSAGFSSLRRTSIKYPGRLDGDEIKEIMYLFKTIYSEPDSEPDGELKKDIDIDELKKIMYLFKTIYSEPDSEPDDELKKDIDTKKYFERYEKIVSNEDKLKSFVIYSPENTALRNFYKEGQIEPLGINGEGLLKLLKVIQNKPPEKLDEGLLKRLNFFANKPHENRPHEQLQEIHSILQLFDWYDELEIPKDLSASEDKVTITDRYLTLAFDQRSANEGFLFVLFYIALMVSDDTPKIFAIDNIDTSLNPKLCTKLVKELVRLAKKYDKQVFVTTHNPAILDGIDLSDDEQRLLVVSRNKQGHTRYKRIALKDKPRSSSNEDLKLSEAFLRGYLGGLPKGF